MKANKLSVLLTSSATVALGLALNASPAGAEEITNEEGVQEQPEENIVLEVKDTPKEQTEDFKETPEETIPPSEDNLDGNISNQADVQTQEDNTVEAPVEDNNLNNQQSEENIAVTSVESAESVQNVNPDEYKRVQFVTGDGNKEDVEEKPSTPASETSVKTDKNGNELTELAKIDDYGYSITTSLDVTDENKPYIDNAVEKVKEEMTKHANDLRSHGINYDAFVEKFPFEVNLVSIKDLPNAGRYYTRFDGPNRTNPVGILELAVSPKKNHITHMLVTHEFSHHTGFRWVHAPSRDHFDKIGEVIDLDATVSENERRPEWKNSNVEKYGEAYTQAFVKGHSNRSATGNLTDEEITAFIELVKNEMNKVGGAPVENDKETDNNEQTQQPSEDNSNLTEDNNKDKDHVEKPSDDNEDGESTETTDKDSNKDDISDLDEETSKGEDSSKEDDSKENTTAPSEDLDNNTDGNDENNNDSESKDEDNSTKEAPEDDVIVIDDILADIKNREDGTEEKDSALVAVENNNKQSKDTTDAFKAPAEEINKDVVNKDAAEAQNTNADGKEVLPDTGEAQSPLTALFAGILGMVGIALTTVFSPRRRKNN